MRILILAVFIGVAVSLIPSVSSAQPYTAPTLLYPSNDTIIEPGSRNMVFRWTRTRGATSLQYYIEISTSPSFKPMFSAPAHTDTFVVVPAVPLPPGDGYWRVRVVADTTTIYSTPPYFHVKVGSPIPHTPVTFFNIPDSRQTLYGTQEYGPIIIGIGLWHQVGIKRVFTQIDIHRDANVVATNTFDLKRTNDSTDRAGWFFAGQWRPTAILMAGDTVYYTYFVVDSTDQTTKFDSTLFRVVIKPTPATTTTTYLKPFTLSNQYIYEFADTTGHEVDSTRRRLRADNVAAGLIHKFNTFCAPTAAAAYADNGPDTTLVNAVAAASHTNVPLDGTTPGGLAMGIQTLANGTRKLDLWLDTLNVMKVPGLDTGITLHRTSPHFVDMVRALKDTNIVLLGLGWWSDSLGVRWKRRGGHFIAGSGFRPDMHWVGVTAINEPERMVTIMDPDCGCLRTMRWGQNGPLTNVLDTAYYTQVATGMTSLVECMVTAKRVYKPLQGVDDQGTPASAQLISAYPNPFTGVTHIAVQGVSDRGATLTITDMLGRVVDATRINANADGTSVLFDGEGLPGGMYVGTLRSGTAHHQFYLLLQK